jgi:hypothetical protein
MAYYDLRTTDGRAALAADRGAELAAARDGRWPRDAADAVRWTAPRGVEPAVWAARMCEADLRSLLEVDR